MFAGASQSLPLYLTLSAIFFAFGLLAVLSRKNAIGIFMGIELMLNAAGINFVAFQALRKTLPGNGTWLHGHLFALFIIVLAAIEAAVALAIVLRVFGSMKSIDPDKAVGLRG